MPSHTGWSFEQSDDTLLYDRFAFLIRRYSIEQPSSFRTVLSRIEGEERIADAHLACIKGVSEIPGWPWVSVWDHHFGERRAIEYGPLAILVLEADLMEHQTLSRMRREVEAPPMPGHLTVYKRHAVG